MTTRDREKQLGYQRKHYEANRERLIAAANDRRKANAEFIRNHRAALGCQICGENHPAVLDFHHRDPAQKENGDLTFAMAGWSRERMLREAEKCDILCSNCHRKTHYRPDET